MTEAGRLTRSPHATERRAVLDVEATQRAAPEFDERLRRDHPKAAAFWHSAPAELPQIPRLLDQRGEAPETRERRFGLLVEACAAGERLP